MKDRPVPDDGYLLANAETPAGRRLQLLGSLFDPVSVRNLERLGVAAGWRCWEVGAGGPSLPRWLAARTGPTGAVLATDIDVSHLPAGEPFDVLVHDVGAEPAPAAGFDLVHARLVLGHVPARESALAAMAAALRPGGYLLVEEADPGLQPLACPEEAGGAEVLANRVRASLRALLADRGADLNFGRKLPRLFRRAGLTDVVAEAFFPLAGPLCGELELATLDQIGQRLVSEGGLSRDEVERHRSNVSRGVLPAIATAPLVSCCGRRPPVDREAAG
jgi:SAM-dependent methyltransferase